MPAVYLEPKRAAALASVTLTVCDQDTEDPQHEADSFEQLVPITGLGFHTFMAVEKLRSRPSYLTGDTLVIRAEVRPLL